MPAPPAPPRPAQTQPHLPPPPPRSELVSRGLEASFVEEEVEAASVGKGSVAVGEVADNIDADLVVLSTAAIHEKHVDANLLAEFVPCPVLMLP